MTHLLSVIMPAWNRASVITRALSSLVEQDIGQVELCLVDDGSTDGTGDVAKAFLSSFASKVQLRYKKTAHGGVSEARNVGLQMSTGELIAYLDSDNTWRPNFASTVVKAFSDNREQKTAYSRLLFLDEDERPSATFFFPFERKSILYQNFIDMNVFVHRRECVERYGVFDTSLARLVDWDLILRYTKDKAPMAVEETLCDYYVGRPGSGRISNTENMNRAMHQVISKNLAEIAAFDLHKQILSGHPHRHATLVQPAWDRYYREILHSLMLDHSLPVNQGS
ncbi:glycosyltransferase [Agrobacterium sp. SHOUNA12C]|jgi:glycosyltransferase involved in cell wall biosynthesis|uniref:glycosyltransferase family 2 protein n=1 Tax=Rhizobium rhizogenes TaxID=359 RepID=UPI0015724FC0|nr:glycosyltransferase [Rhizobium rhizogenes]MCJ9722128.1 glycosyltransferase [Agrobacterium sp. BETTINA12B]MCJ9758935.1 glycosyltransferase [Agrobacterium sp. SHOUNA12C]NTF83004.1 glycosyltransferase [Rhizobium rhizogenes]NTG09344.1 glycosyltransferase [Rhizobium rhizogenes]NTG36256.1 glycosyltransferase [Rhizobium rhizogenes]